MRVKAGKPDAAGVKLRAEDDAIETAEEEGIGAAADDREERLEELTEEAAEAEEDTAEELAAADALLAVTEVFSSGGVSIDVEESSCVTMPPIGSSVGPPCSSDSPLIATIWGEDVLTARCETFEDDAVERRSRSFAFALRMALARMRAGDGAEMAAEDDRRSIPTLCSRPEEQDPGRHRKRYPVTSSPAAVIVAAMPTLIPRMPRYSLWARHHRAMFVCMCISPHYSGFWSFCQGLGRRNSRSALALESSLSIPYVPICHLLRQPQLPLDPLQSFAMSALEDTLRLYDYDFPQELIAKAPASPRDSARLLVYDRRTGERHDAIFRDIGAFLPKNAVLVLNTTKVIPARLALRRATGGTVSVLALGTSAEGVRVMANRKLKIGEKLELTEGDHFTVAASEGKYWLLHPSFTASRLQEMLDAHGQMPLPPYIKQTPLSPAEQRREYQSVFASVPGSIAAPTASLHFTPELPETLLRSGIEIVTLTLHVHLGTFAPLTDEQWQKGALHSEEYVIDPEAVSRLEVAKAAGRPIVAVGTTVVRTLESASDGSGRIIRPRGTTDLFIREGYRFTFVDSLVTNFHVPRSSLLMLVSAFTGREKVLELYRHAIAEHYRLFSFGDAMLIR